MSLQIFRCRMFIPIHYDSIHSVLTGNSRVFTVFTKKLSGEYKYHILERLKFANKIKSVDLTEGFLVCNDFHDYLHQIKNIIENIAYPNGTEDPVPEGPPDGIGKCNSCGKVNEGNYFHAIKNRGYIFICNNCQERGEF